jgi:uncharacterized membrane protein YvbJ
MELFGGNDKGYFFKGFKEPEKPFSSTFVNTCRALVSEKKFIGIRLGLFILLLIIIIIYLARLVLMKKKTVVIMAHASEEAKVV